jgi:hypothetical protein
MDNWNQFFFFFFFWNVFLLEKLVLNKTLFEPMRQNHWHVIIKLEVGYQISLFVTMQEVAIAANKQVLLLGNNLCPAVPQFLLEMHVIHHRQFDLVVIGPDIMVQQKDGHPCHVILTDGRGKLATHLKQVHRMAGLHSRGRAHVPEGLRHRVKRQYPVVVDTGVFPPVQVQDVIDKDWRAKDVYSPPPAAYPRITHTPGLVGSHGEDAVRMQT